MIFAQDAEFLATIQQFGRFYRIWDILQTDKLRIVDRGAVVTADITLDRTTVDRPGHARQGRDHQRAARAGAVSTIDPDADYTIVPSKAVRPREPVNVSSSVSTESVYLPMIMDSGTRKSLVTYTKYQEEVARKKITGTAMMYGLQIEPGDLVALLNLGDDFINEVFKIIETTHGQNYTVEFVAEAILRCSLVVEDGTDPISSTWCCCWDSRASTVRRVRRADRRKPASITARPPGGNPHIDTAEYKFGSSSLRYTAVSSALVFPDSTDWDLSNSNSDQFTVECWARFHTITGPSNIWSRRHSGRAVRLVVETSRHNG